MAAAVVEAADRVKVLLPLPGALMLTGAKLGVTPLGAPLTENPTDELNPYNTAVVRVTWADLPAPTLALVALGDKVKLGGGVTVRLKP